MTTQRGTTEPKVSMTKHAPLRLLALAGMLAAVALAPASRAASPLESSWLTSEGASYARIYRSQTEALAGSSVTTWLKGGRITGGGQTNPAYAGVQSIRVSSNYVYVQSSSLPGYVMGPWYFDAAKMNLFINWPSKKDLLARFPRVPSVAGTPNQRRTSLGAIALWVDGGIIHNQLDAFYWDGTADVNTVSVFTQSWQRNAQFAEGLTWDPSGSHQPFTGERHHHINPAALRHSLADHVDYHPATHTYTESTQAPQHSPILGWAFDGYPIYGPYGYSSATNTNSTVRRIVSGYVFRDGTGGSTDLRVTGRTTYPQWALAIGKPTALNGPPVSASFPLGWYVQDFDHLADHGYAQGTDFDLDRYNGRVCRTPEFPSGTYAYFITINADSTPAWPYIIGLQYFGWRNGGDYGAPATIGFTSVETPNVTNYLGGANAAVRLNAPAFISPTTITLAWTSAEGGHYTVETNANLATTNWSAQAANVRAGGTTAQTNLAAVPGANVFRVARTSLDAYDSVTTP